MSQQEFEIVQEEKAIAFMSGIMLGVTSTAILGAIIITLIHYGL